NSSTVLKNKYGAEVARWKPTPLDGWSLPVSSQGWCYTEIDTIIRFKDDGGGQRALVVFSSTGKLQPGYGDFPVLGAAEFYRTAPGWTITSFDIGLAEGYTGNAGLAKCGKDKFALEVPGGIATQGFLKEWVTYFETARFDKIFTLMTHEDNEGAVGKNEKGYYAYDVDIKFIKTTGAYDHLEAKSHGTKATEDGEKIISANNTRSFYFDEFAGQYLEMKK
ncbi:MAG: hypothetical protein IT259_03995, partial [Saprospiraceae bacterium]|nr:hypothetical protein [Saprospiraceae bacterium]